MRNRPAPAKGPAETDGDLPRRSPCLEVGELEGPGAAGFALGEDLRALLVNLIRRPALALSASGEVLSCNGAALDLLGVGADTCRGVPVGNLGSPSLAEAATRALETPGSEFAVATSIRGPGGTRRAVRCDGVSYAAARGGRGALVILTDLRPLKGAGAERSHELGLIGLAVASSAHEIKNTLTGMEGGAALVRVGLQREDLARVRTGWALAERNMDRIRSLVGDVLALSRDAPLVFSEGRPDQLAQEAVADMKPRAYAAGVCLTLEAEGPLAAVPMCKKALHQCVVNLVANAIAACAREGERRPREVRVRVAPAGADELEVSVTDTGPGIPERDVPKILEGFRTTKGSGGTGLGLLVVQKHLRAHGGRLEVKGREGLGATFSMILPAHPRAAQE